jgi:hypothetical protein
MGVLDDVRSHATQIAASSRFVTINQSAIASYARTLQLTESPELDPATHYSGEPDATLAYVVTLDAINFGSGYFPHLKKRPGMSGYFTVASSLKDAWPLSLPELRNMTSLDCSRIFGQPPGEDDAVDELMAMFAQALNDLGSFVGGRFDESFAGLVASAEGSAEQLAAVLAAMPFYRDVGFYKRAQLTAADLSLANVASFTDLHELTIFADNLVPHVLRVDGVLHYEAGLLDRINREELIPRGSPEEQEIRACALHAVELIKAQRPGVTAMELDYTLWNRGQLPAYKAEPRHRTRTVFY